MRNKRTNISTIHTATKAITLHGSQCFYETPKAYEIWQESVAASPRISYSQETRALGNRKIK